ncbi:MAG: MATE family efflux transporter [Herpetosiphon sp.]
MAVQTTSLPMQQQKADRRQLWWAVFALAMPAVGEQFLNMLVGLSDTFLVGHIHGDVAARLGYTSAAALAAVGLASYVVWVVTSLFMAVAAGTTALVARAMGSGDHQTAREALNQSLLLGVAMGLAGVVIASFPAEAEMRLLGAAPEVQALGSQFLHIASLTMPLSGLLFIGTAALRGAGDTRTPLFVMLLINGINIGIAWTLVNGAAGIPALGLAGSAWAAAIARGVGGIVVVLALIRRKGALRLRQMPRPQAAMLKRILRIGLPTGGEQLAFQGALMIFARQIAGLGTVAYAAHNTVLTIESVSFLPGLGFGVAATTLVGQWLGAKDPAAARTSTHASFWQGAAFMALMGLLFMVIPKTLLGFMVNDPQVVAAGAGPLRVVGMVQPLLAANFVYAGGLRGAGDTRYPLWVKLISPWLVRLPLALVLIPSFGLFGAWVALSVDLAFQGVLSYWRFRGPTWERIEV